MNTPSCATRFAPSPNGELHLGHAYSALFSAAVAKQRSGAFILRIEDIDQARCKASYREQIFTDLAWLGLSWMEPVMVQSSRLPHYRDTLDKLAALGLLYPCFCSRKEIAATAAEGPNPARDPDGAWKYPGTCRNLDDTVAENPARPFSLRLDMQRAVTLARSVSETPISFHEYGSGPNGETGHRTIEPEIWGDVILARKDIGTSYHIAVIVDDHDQAISDITRGGDLFHATHLHRLLQVLLGLSEPRYHHHRLIDDASGQKLSKSTGSLSLRALREDGVSAMEIRRFLGFN